MGHKARKPTTEIPADLPDDIQRITPRILVEAFGGTEVSWVRRRPELRRRGLLNQYGRYDFGSLKLIAHALVTQDWSSALKAK